jgi:hypothetical protein
MTRRKKQTPGRPLAATRPVSRRVPATVRSAEGPTRLKITSPAQLLGLIPYLLGFRPEESLVLLLIRDGQVLLSARIDIVGPEEAASVAQQFAYLAEHNQASGIVLFAYSREADPARRLLAGLIDGLGPHGLLDAIYVDGTRWWSLTCDDACCPAEGTPYDLSSHPMAAEAVFAGLTAANGRDDIERQVSGPGAADFGRLRELTRQCSAELADLDRDQRKRLMGTSVEAYLSEPRTLSETECVQLALLASDVIVRDIAWAKMTRRDAEDHVDLWRQVVAHTVSPWEPAPLCLLGMAAWIAGNGTLQNCCSDRVRLVDPGYSMAGLLEDINLRALPPSFWDLMASDMRAIV